jgi:Protein of unknown function, DUF547
MTKLSYFTVLILLAYLLIPSAALSEELVDQSIYAELLQKYVKNGVVNYAGFKSEEDKLDRYLNILESTDIKSLPRNEQFAVYINAYNAWTIKLILSRYPGVKSIKDLGSLLQSPWKKKIVHIDGKVITLDDLEHSTLRPRFKDPRVHFAINCASKSCPPLRSEPYRGDILDRQLDDATRSFLNNPENFRFEGDKFYVSKIFDWYGEDFNNDVLGFYLKYANDGLKQKLQQRKGSLRIDYLDYDWSLNGF